MKTVCLVLVLAAVAFAKDCRTCQEMVFDDQAMQDAIGGAMGGAMGK